MKYCGVVTPFCGIRVYTQCAMGILGSETALEELICRVLGNLLQEGYIARLVDDLYSDGNSPEELLGNWECILDCLQNAGLCLSPSKTIIAPKNTTLVKRCYLCKPPLSFNTFYLLPA